MTHNLGAGGGGAGDLRKIYVWKTFNIVPNVKFNLILIYYWKETF